MFVTGGNGPFFSATWHKNKKSFDLIISLNMHCSEILSSVKLLTMYRRFGTTYRFHLKGSRRRILDPCRRDRQVVPKLRHRVTTLRCLISQSNADRVRIAAKSLKRLVVKYLYTFRIYKEIVKLHC